MFHRMIPLSRSYYDLKIMLQKSLPNFVLYQSTKHVKKKKQIAHRKKKNGSKESDKTTSDFKNGEDTLTEMHKSLQES